jgi:hypothetical protein
MARIATAASIALIVPGMMAACLFADDTVEHRRSTLDDQRDVAITVYNQNLGLVKDRRSIDLPKGILSLSFMDVAAKIDPTTVHIRSLTDPEALAVHEQNYEYDLISPSKLLEKYVGKEVRLIEINPETGAETETAATILSTHDGLVYRTEEGITFDPGRGGSTWRRWFFPGIPENLISEPTLVWRLESGRRGTQDVEASYLTSGIGWKADYVGLLNDDDTRMDLTGWVTIENRSGATYRNATLKLVAGDVHRAERRPTEARRGRGDMMLEMAASAPRFEEKAFFEYHLYTLDRRTTIKENQTKQMTLFDAPGVTVTKKFVYRGTGSYFVRWIEPAKSKVGVFLRFENEKTSGMGLPLPAGIVRIYKEDTDGSVQFLGEDRIDHTPVDETVELKIGEAFDVVAERKQTDFRKIGDKVRESAYEIAVRNHKEEAVTVEVVETIPGDWEILSHSHEYEKEKVNQVRFRVPVGAGREAKVTYRVRIR